MFLELDPTEAQSTQCAITAGIHEGAERKVSDTVEVIRAEVFESVCLWYDWLCTGTGVLLSYTPC